MRSEYKILVDYLKEHGAKQVSIFGSRARQTHTPQSDLDVLVEFTEAPSLLSFVKFERELSELMGIKIDLLTQNSVSPLILKHIEKDRINLYQ